MTKSDDSPERSRAKDASTLQRPKAARSHSEPHFPTDRRGETEASASGASRRVLERGAVSHGGETPDLSGITVLLICASDNTRNMLRQILRHLGAEIVVGKDVAALADPLAASTADIAVISSNAAQQSDLTGFCEIRRTTPLGERFPILALVAGPEHQPVDWADAAIVAPIMSAHDLGAAISALLRSPEADIKAPPSPEFPASPHLVEERLRALMQLAGPAHRDELLQHLDDDLSRVSSGLQTAVEQRDFAGIRAQAHVLVSLAGTVDATVLQQVATTLNTAARHQDVGSIDHLAAQAHSGIAALLDIVRHTAPQ